MSLKLLCYKKRCRYFFVNCTIVIEKLDSQTFPIVWVSYYFKLLHKIDYIYGAAWVALSEKAAQLLEHFIITVVDTGGISAHPYAAESVVKVYQDSSPPLFSFPNAGFTSVWRQVRLKNPYLAAVTNTAYRHYIETKVRRIVNKDLSKLPH